MGVLSARINLIFNYPILVTSVGLEIGNLLRRTSFEQVCGLVPGMVGQIRGDMPQLSVRWDDGHGWKEGLLMGRVIILG